jgi:hypothetical protein
MGIEATGKLHTIFETKQMSERFSKREFVLEMADNPKYPQTVLFQLSGDRCAQLDGFEVGDQVRIEFSLRGREWRSPQGDVKYFNSLDVWKLERAGASSNAYNDRGSYNGGGNGGGNGARRDSRGGGQGNGRSNGGYAELEIPPPRDEDARPVSGDDLNDLPF